MSKLFKFKSWLTVPETAQYLSTLLGEAVKESDVLRLALDGHLKLSVNFVNQAQANYGHVVPLDGAKSNLAPNIESNDQYNECIASFTEAPESSPHLLNLIEIIKSMPNEMLGCFSPLLASLKLDSEHYLHFEERIRPIDGVWDLMMVGYERLDIEQAYQYLTHGPTVTFAGLEGVFVTNNQGTVCSIQYCFDEDETDSLWDDLKEMKARHSEFYSARRLPTDCVLVVRTEALREFEEAASDEKPLAKPLHVSERKSAAQIIRVLAEMATVDVNAPYASDEVLRLAAAKAGLELPSSSETVVKFLKMAADLPAGK